MQKHEILVPDFAEGGGKRCLVLQVYEVVGSKHKEAQRHGRGQEGKLTVWRVRC